MAGPHAAYPRPAGPRTLAALCLVLVAVAALAFHGVVRCDFVNYDDPDYVVENPQVRQGLTLEGAAWALTSLEYSNWHPLTWLSHMADVSLWGLDPAGHHLTNLLLHAANAVLLFLALAALTRSVWRSALAALLFAAHPLHVESVAWVAERKDLLSTLFALAALLAYAGYARRGGLGRWLAVAAAMALSLAAKPMYVTLPFLLLVLDAWPLGRLGRGNPARPVLEKLPLLALSAGSSVVTVMAQQAGHAVHSVEVTSLAMRLYTVAFGYCAYLAKLLFPFEQTVLYPMHRSISPGLFAGSVALLAAVTATAWLARRRDEVGLAPLCGWLWFLGLLVPVVGFVPVGNHAYADRYVYLASAGVFVMLTWGVWPLLQKRQRLRAAALPAAALVCAALVGLTTAQVRHWGDSEALFRHAVAVTEGNYIARNNLGTALAAQGTLREALRHFQRSVEINPEYPVAWNNLGNALRRLGRPGQAREAFTTALDIKPDYASAWNNLGLLHLRQGRDKQALAAFLRAVEAAPDDAEAHFNLGVALLRAGQPARAAQSFSRALERRPGYGAAWTNLGGALMRLGRFQQALRAFERAVELKPGDPDARRNLERAKRFVKQQ